MISIHFLYDEELIEKEIDESGDLVQEATKACQSILMESLAVGYNTVMISTNEWTASHVNPYKIAVNLGLHVFEQSLADILPANTFVKPILSLSEQILGLSSYLTQGLLKSVESQII